MSVSYAVRTTTGPMCSGLIRLAPSECLKEAVVAAMAERMRRRLDEVKGDPEATERLQKEIMRGEFP